MTPGQHPLAARRINYFQSPKFEGCFDPHPDHPPPLTLAELAARDAYKELPPVKQPQLVYERHPGFLESLWQFLTVDHPAIGGCVGLGFIALLVIAWLNIGSSSITSGAAVVANAPQLNLRSCPAANCGIVTTLNKGDPVTVTRSFNNGWKAVTVRYTDGTSARGFVNGDFLRRP